MKHSGPDERRERGFHTFGLAMCVILTVASFASVMTGLLPPVWVLPVLIVLALAQVIVQFRYFLHIDLTRQKREDLQLLLFTVLLLAIMAFGTLWVIGDLADRM